MNILVTGATGFLGRAMVLRLNQEGFNVIATGRNLEVGRWLNEHGIDFKAVDLLDYNRVVELTRNQHFVVHAAALTRSWGSYAEFYASNVLVTQNIVNACLQLGIERLVHISTPSLYMTHEPRLGILEDEPLPEKMINHYAATKKLAEDEVDLGVQAGLSCITLRPQAIFGPGDTTLMPRLLNMAQRGFYPVLGSEPVYLDLTYIDNIVDAVLLALETQNGLGLKYNITNGQPVCLELFLRDLFGRLKIQAQPKRISYPAALRMAALTEGLWKTLRIQREPPVTRYSVCALGRSRTLNIDRAKEILGYSPKVSLEEGLTRTVSAIQSPSAG